VKWKIATASVVTAAMLSAPVAGAAPSDGGGANNVANNAVGQVIGQVTGTNPAVIIDTLNGLQGLLGKLGFGKDHGNGNGNGAQLQQATMANVGKTLKKPEIYGAKP